MATIELTFSGDVDKYRAELWDADLTAKIEDIPLETPYIAEGGTTQQNSNLILFIPLDESITFDRSTDNVDLNMPWNKGLELRKTTGKGVPLPVEQRCIVLFNTWIDNVSNSPTFNLYYFGEVETVIHFNRLHLMDAQALEALSNARLIETGTGGEEIFNYSIYIINLLQLNFELGGDYIAGDSDIILGERNTNIETPLFKSDSIVVPLGEIEIPDSDSSLDYFSNTFELFLPFIADPINIDASLCIGKTLAVDYVIDLYTGDITVNVYNGELFPVVSRKDAIGRIIPTKLVSEVTGIVSGANGVSNDVLTAYVRHTKPELVNGQFYNLVSKSGTIGNYKGYLEVENIELGGSFLAYEKERIISLLRNGVNVK